MCVDRVNEILGRCFHHNRQGSLGNQIRDFRSNHVYTEYLTIFPLGNHSHTDPVAVLGEAGQVLFDPDGGQRTGYRLYCMKRSLRFRTAPVTPSTAVSRSPFA